MSDHRNPARVPATARLTLRPLTQADLVWLTALHGDAAVMRYIGDGRPVHAGEVADRTLPGILAEYDRLRGWCACSTRGGPDTWLEFGDVVYALDGATGGQWARDRDRP